MNSRPSKLRLLVASFTFFIGVAAVGGWLSYIIPAVEFLEDPDCVAPSDLERSTVRCVQPALTLSLCEIAENPSRYDGKTIRVRAAVTGYHHLHLYDPTCIENTSETMADFESNESVERFRRAASALPLVNGNIQATMVLIGRLESTVENQEAHHYYAGNGNDRFRFVVTSVERVEGTAPDVP